MAGKKRLGPALLSSTAKRKKNESDVCRSVTRVVLLEQMKRWDHLKAVLNMKSDRTVADVLLELTRNGNVLSVFLS